jgi:hypothetical protein
MGRAKSELLRALEVLPLQKKGTGRGEDYKMVRVCLNDASDECGNGVCIDVHCVDRWRKLLTVEEWGKRAAAARYAPVEAILVRVPAFPGITADFPPRRKGREADRQRVIHYN